MKIEARFTFDKVQYNKENDNHLVLTLKAPAIDWQKRRSPICIIPVIDCSGSMADHSKMEYAKLSAMKLVDHLQPGDFMGIIGFSNQPFVVSAPAEITQDRKEQLRADIGRLIPLASTNLSDAVILGLESGNKLDLPENVSVRIILLTDGLANAGVATKEDQIIDLFKKARKRCAVSAFGYGTDADQNMLGGVAHNCEGNYAFIRNPEDALVAFGKELGGLLSAYANNIVIEIVPHSGHVVSEVLSDVDVEEEKGKIKIKLSDILSEEERHIVLAVKLSEQKQALPRQVNVFDVNVSYDMIHEDGSRVSKTEEAKARLQFVKSGDEQTKADKAVDHIVGLAQLVKTQIEAENHATVGDYKGAQHALNAVYFNLSERGLGSIATATSNLTKKYENNQTYNSSAGYRNSMKIGAARSHKLSSTDSEAQADLGNMDVLCSNSSEAYYANAFAEVPSVPTADGSGLSGGSPVSLSTSVTIPPLVVKEEKKIKKSKSKRW